MDDLLYRLRWILAPMAVVLIFAVLVFVVKFLIVLENGFVRHFSAVGPIL